MHGYVSTERLLLKTGNRQFKVVPPATSLEAAEVSRIQLEAAEYDLVREQLKEKFGEDSLAEKLKIAPDQMIAAWQHFPPRLGRISLSLIEREKTFDHQSEHLPLGHQLRLLKQRTPWKKHFRIAIVNGFGGNLGDNLIGITAFREVVKVLQAELGTVSVDILFGWMTNPACKDLFSHEPYIENVYFSGLPLTRFGHYDAHFDIAHLILYPKYDSMPVVDWYLWWLGLEPNEIGEKSKRNKLTLPYAVWGEVSSLLKTRSEKKILFVHRASVPLRSIPEAQARRILTELISEAPKEYILVTDIGLGLQHPRLLDLSGKIDSADKFKALIAQVDALVTIDSFAQHVADATATASVLLSAVLPESFYPYYPFQGFVLLPGAESLPAWKRVKTTPEEWEKIKDSYSDAWVRLKGKDIYAQVEKQLFKRVELLSSEGASFSFADHSPRASFTSLQLGTYGKKTIRWKYESPSEAWEKASDCLMRLGQPILRPGCVVTHVCPATSKVPVALSEYVYPMGEYHIWEPRRLYAQTQAANFILAGMDFLTLHTSLPAASGISKSQLQEIDPFSESNPAQAGNAHHPHSIDIEPVDHDSVSMCRLLIIQPPAPLTDTIQAFTKFISAHQPFLLLGPLVQDSNLLSFLNNIRTNDNFTFYIDPVGLNHRSQPSVMLIGIPPDEKVNMQGFTELSLEPQLTEISG